MATWTPSLDDVDRAILDWLDSVGESYLRMIDLTKWPELEDLTREDILNRLEILIAAGYVRRYDHFSIAPDGAALVEQARGEGESREPPQPTGSDSRLLGDSHDAPPPPAEPEREPQTVRSRGLQRSATGKVSPLGGAA